MLSSVPPWVILSAGNLVNNANPMILFIIASLTSYSVYKRYEPVKIFPNIVLLLAVPSLVQYQMRAYTPGIPLRLLTVTIAYWASLIACTVVYRVSPFHPLHQFPGPFLAKISKFWMARFALRGDSHEYVRGLHALYGDVVRIGPNELSFNRGDLVEPILTMKLLPKGPYFDTRERPAGVGLDGMRNLHAHAIRRKPWSKGMSIAAIKGYQDIIENKTQELVDALSERAGQTVDISSWMGYFGFDFMGQIVFGRDFGMVKAANDITGLRNILDKGIAVIAVISHIPWILPFLRLIPGPDRDFWKLEEFAAECIAHRMKEHSQTKDLFYYLTGEDDSSARPSEQTIASDGVLAVIGGSDTTSIAMSNLWFFLLKHPECREKLEEEIDTVFPHDEEPSDFLRHANMQYLNACLNETLRMYPPVISGLQRRVEKGTGGTLLGDWYVPEQTQVSLHHYSLHHDPREFNPIPNTFWPERWLDQDKYVLPTGEIVNRDQVITHRSSFLPFSVGPQNCAGKSLAIVEMRAVICAVVSKFEMGLAPGFVLEDWERSLRDKWTIARGPLPVRLKLRKV